MKTNLAKKILKSPWTASIIANSMFVAALGVSFSSTPPPPQILVDTISAAEFSELSQLTAGNKNAAKAETPKPLVDKVDTPKPIPTPEPVPTVVDKPEIKPIPRETLAEQKPPEPKPAETKAEKTPTPPKPDLIAEALKKEDARKAAEAKAKAALAKKKPQPVYNPDEIAIMLDKRDPQRQAATGEAVEQNPSLGVSSGSAPMLTQSEVDALRARLMQLWNPPAGVLNPQDLVVKIRVKLGRDRKLAAPPMVLTSGRGTVFEAARDGAVRALFQGQPYDMLMPEHFDLWKEMEITFDPREMVPG